MEYHLVGGYSPSELDRFINKLLKEGWELYGSPFCGGGTMGALYQAVIKRPKKPVSKDLGPYTYTASNNLLG